jgi:hypothetical protein
MRLTTTARSFETMLYTTKVHWNASERENFLSTLTLEDLEVLFPFFPRLRWNFSVVHACVGTYSRAYVLSKWLVASGRN